VFFSDINESWSPSETSAPEINKIKETQIHYKTCFTAVAAGRKERIKKPQKANSAQFSQF